MAYNGLQGGGSTSFVQGAAASGSRLQPTSSTRLTVQPASSGRMVQSTSSGSMLNQGGSGSTLGARTVANTTNPGTDVAIDPAADAAAKAAADKAAADAARSGQLRGEITDLVNRVKDLINSRYGQIDQVASEQSGKLDSRYAKESGQITDQATDQSNQASGAFAGRGTRDSSDYGNTVDTITRDAKSQIGDLGDELSDNKAAIGGEVLKEKAGLDSNKSAVDAMVKHINEETNPDNLVTLRAQIDAKLAEAQSGNADNVTAQAARTALNSIAPTSARQQQLKTTLSKIVGGNAPAGQKQQVAQTLIANSGLDPADQQKLLQAFSSDISSTDKQIQQQ